MHVHSVEESHLKANIKHCQIWRLYSGRLNLRLTDFIALCKYKQTIIIVGAMNFRLKIAASTFGKNFNTMVIEPIILIKLASNFLQISLSKENSCTQWKNLSLKSKYTNNYANLKAIFSKTKFKVDRSYYIMQIQTDYYYSWTNEQGLKKCIFPGNIVTFPTISYVFLYVKSQNFPPSCQISHKSHYQITLFFPTMPMNFRLKIAASSFGKKKPFQNNWYQSIRYNRYQIFLHSLLVK